MAVEERHAAMTAKLDARHQSRRDELEATREANDAQARPEEKVQAFEAGFKAAVTDIESLLQKSETISGRVAINALFDDLDGMLLALNKQLADSAHFLPSFDVRHSQQTIKGLQDLVEETRLNKLPKKKFAFKGKKSRQTESAATASASISTAAVGASTNSKQLSYHNLSDQTIVIDAAASTGADVSLKDLTNCQIYIKGTPDAFHISNLKSCKLCVGPVTRSLLIDGCDHSRLYIACQQLRIHNTKATQFYIHVTSRAIIEDCEQLQFAPYNWHYATLDQDYEVSRVGIWTVPIGVCNLSLGIRARSICQPLGQNKRLQVAGPDSTISTLEHSSRKRKARALLRLGVGRR
eukprot:m.74359 g.74359  ORF g.74359 m.74359 type:complete len:351 (+) comp14356_c0_seq4:132-1184(+)